MQIDGRQIGSGHTPYVVCEISGEHKGSPARAVALIRAAKEAGASAAKLQLYDPARLAEARSGLDLNGTPWVGRLLADLYAEAHTPIEWFPNLFDAAKAFDITIFSSVFDKQGVEYLETLGCPAYKVASKEAADVALVTKAAATSKPLIISTGTATDEQLGRSLAEAKRLTTQVALLYCVSEYPARIESIDFDQIEWLRHRYQVPVGFSDHTLGIEAAVKAVECGASIIEKHITLSRGDGGPDAAFSLEPAEFKQMVSDVKDAYASLGTGERPKSEEMYRSLRRKPD